MSHTCDCDVCTGRVTARGLNRLLDSREIPTSQPLYEEPPITDLTAVTINESLWKHLVDAESEAHPAYRAELRGLTRKEAKGAAGRVSPETLAWLVEQASVMARSGRQQQGRRAAAAFVMKHCGVLAPESDPDPEPEPEPESYGAGAHPVDWETKAVHHCETGELLGYVCGETFIFTR